jgi:hypothetical protein
VGGIVAVATWLGGIVPVGTWLDELEELDEPEELELEPSSVAFSGKGDGSSLVSCEIALKRLSGFFVLGDSLFNFVGLGLGLVDERNKEINSIQC